jgi:hypothetical protein
MNQPEFVITILAEGPQDDDELEQAGIELAEELREIDGVRLSRRRAPAPPPDTKAAVDWIPAVLVLTAMGGRVAQRQGWDETAKEISHDIRDISHDIRAVVSDFAKRHKGKKIRVEHPDGTVVDTTGVGERGVSKILKNLPPGQRNSGE